MAVRIPLVPPGSRVRIRRGSLPLDPTVIGRSGTVIGSSEYRPTRVDVALDGGAGIRQFSPAELERLEPLELPPDRESASRRRALP